MRFLASSVRATKPRMTRMTPTIDGMSAVGEWRGEANNPTRPSKIRTTPNIMVSFAMRNLPPKLEERFEFKDSRPGIGWLCRLQLTQYLARNDCGRLGRVCAQGNAGHLQRLDLAFEQGGIHEVPWTLTHAGFERRDGDLKQNEAVCAGRHAFHKYVAIPLL